MQYRLVALLLQLPQHPSYLPFADVHFRCRLSARDQPLGGFLQHYQTVSLPLGHSQNSWFFHSPSVTLSSGHFYLAQTGHYHVATPFTPSLTSPRCRACRCRGLEVRDERTHGSKPTGRRVSCHPQSC